MTETKPARKATQRSTKSSTRNSSKGFTSEERAAMKERARELKSKNGEGDLLAKIAEMKGSDRAMAERIHALVMAAAPGLEPKTWYGMPAYAKGGKVVCFFQSAAKFKARYATFGFSDEAKLDQGSMWPTSFALTEMTKADEAKLAALVKKAVR